MPPVAKVNHHKYPVQLALGVSGFDRDEVWEVYSRFEKRAVYLLKGWENTMGVTPDDIAQTAFTAYLSLRKEGFEPDDAYPQASRGLQQDIHHLWQKAANNPTDYFEEPEREESDTDEDPGQAEMTAAESAALYFDPDRVDWLASLLSRRETEAVILRYEADLDLHGVATSMGVSYETAKTLVKRALKKLRGGLSP